jgi:hypothetical protein
MNMFRTIALALLVWTAALPAQNATRATVSVMLDPAASSSALSGRLLDQQSKAASRATVDC